MDETKISTNPVEENGDSSQQDVDAIVSRRVSKESKWFLNKLGIEKKEDIDGLLAKLKDAGDYHAMKNERDNLLTQVNTLTAEKTKSQYTRVIEKQNVDDELIEFVYSKVEPKKDEKLEDYKTRVEEYLANHTNYIKGNLQTIDTSANLSGKSTKQVSANKIMNDLIRGKKG